MNNARIVILSVTIFFTLGISGFSQSFADSEIPSWVKNISIWWGEGEISDLEYLESIKFLVTEEIIHLDSNTVHEAKNNGYDTDSFSLASKFKIEILLPLYYNPDENGVRKKIGDNEFSETYKDLMKQFGGCTIVPNPVSGGWINPDTGTEITDELIAYWVIYENTEENIEFLKNFKEVLKERFKQEYIMMYSVSITQF